MQKHTIIYMEALGYAEGDFIPCEMTGGEAVDIHHINARGMGGDPHHIKDCIENLMAVTRARHEDCESGEISKEEQIEAHFNFLRSRGIEFNENWHEEMHTISP